MPELLPDRPEPVEITEYSVSPETFLHDIVDLDVPCKGQPELFFPVNGRGTSSRYEHMRVRRAKEICGACAVRAACLEGALLRREASGVWGGESIKFGKISRKPR